MMGKKESFLEVRKEKPNRTNISLCVSERRILVRFREEED